MGKYAVITGAGSGIGRATAKEFASKGFSLIIVDVNKESLLTLKNELGNETEIQVMPCDLSDENSVYELYEKTKAYEVAVWVNNAGLGNMCPILETDVHKAILLNRVNVDAAAILTLLYAQDYQNKDAVLINVSSWNGYSITQGNPVYSATKFYLSALSEALYWELKRDDKPMKIKLICPAATKTAFVRASAVNKEPGEIKDYDELFDKCNTAEEVAGFIYEMYQSEELIGYADGTDYTFHKTGPKLPHTYNKSEIPCLLIR